MFQAVGRKNKIKGVCFDRNGKGICDKKFSCMCFFQGWVFIQIYGGVQTGIGTGPGPTSRPNPVQYFCTIFCVYGVSGGRIRFLIGRRASLIIFGITLVSRSNRCGQFRLNFNRSFWTRTSTISPSLILPSIKRSERGLSTSRSTVLLSSRAPNSGL